MFVFRCFVAALFCTLLTGTAFAQSKNKVFITKAKTALAQNFKDPRSAQWRGVFISYEDPLRYLCGEVNAKNSYGAYTGFKRFFTLEMNSILSQVESEENAPIFEEFYLQHCGNRVYKITD